MRIISFLLLITVFLLGFLFLVKDVEPPGHPSSFLPADTLLYLEQHEGSRALKRFQNSRLGKSLAMVEYRQPLLDSDIPTKYIDQLASLQKTFAYLKNNRLVQELLGEVCSIALLSQRNWASASSTVTEYLTSHTLLISKPKIQTDTLRQLIEKYLAGYSFEHVLYGRFIITRYNIGKMTLAITFADGFMLASLEERVIREALSLHENPTGSLQNDQDFRTFYKKLNTADRMAYFAIDGLQDLTTYIAGRTDEEKLRAILTEFSSFKGLTSLSYGAWRKNVTIKDTFFVSFDKQLMDSGVREMISTPASINDTLPFVSKDMLLYYWSNTLNFRLLWDMYTLEAGGDDAGVEKIRTVVNEFSGYEMNELIQMFNSNVGFFLRQSDRKQFVPIPDFAMMIQLNEPETIEAIIEKGLHDLDINIQGRTYKNVKYHYWGLYAQESLQPVYAIHRDYLIFANTFDILRSIIDTPINGSRLIGSEKFAQLDPGFQRLNNSVCYVNQGLLFNHLQELISWSGTLLAIQDREAAKKSKILIEKLIDPLFTGMAMFDKSASRTYIKDSTIVIESRTETTQ